MLSQKIIEKIESKEISSRRQLWKELGIFGQKPELRKWLDGEGILIPANWNKNTITNALQAFKRDNGRMPKSCEFHNTSGMVRATRRYFGSWNDALAEVFGEVNQKRYAHFSDEQLLEIVRDFVIKNQRIPLRQDFDGIKYPYYEVYTVRFNVKKWSDILGMIDLAGVQYYHNSQHGSGRVFVEDGVVYLSHQEYLIGRWLKSQNILFEKEVPYDNCGYIFDFFLVKENVYIEYYGRMHHENYREKVVDKRKFYNGRDVIEIFNHDNTIQKLSEKVQRL